MRHVTSFVTVLAAVLTATGASASELDGYVSKAGVDYIASSLPSMIPESLQLEPITKELGEICEGDIIAATISDSNIEMQVHSANIGFPTDGRVTVAVEFSVAGDGQLEVQNSFGCFGTMTCGTEFFMRNANVAIEFDIGIENGSPSVTLRDMDLDIEPYNMDLELSDCAVDSVINYIVDFGREYLLEQALGLLGDMAVTQLQPVLTEMLVGFGEFDTSVQGYGVAAGLSALDVYPAGLHVAGDVDLYAASPTHPCIKNDPGEPNSHAGATPPTEMFADHIAVAANLGIFDDALYHVWRSGLFCIDEVKLAAQGLDLNLEDHVGKLLPGFPAGTRYALDVYLAKPLRIRGSAGTREGLTAIAEGFEIDIVGRRPDGSDASIRVELDVSLEANLGINHSINGLYVSLHNPIINRLVIEDEIGATDIGFDTARLRDVLEAQVLPHLMESMGQVPVTGSVFGAKGMYLMLRNFAVESAYVAVGMDLFVAPKNDSQAPNTLVESAPSRPVSVANAVVVATGTDDKIPTELLQYVFTVDGVAAEPSFVREAHIGIAGETKSYQVEVSAVDLHGNVDMSPASLEVTVDGIVPYTHILGGGVHELSSETHELRWDMSDDLTEQQNLTIRLELFKINDPTSGIDAQKVGEVALESGVTRATVGGIKDGNLYRVELVVSDEAGNESRASVLLKTPSFGSGCSTTGGSMGGLPLALAVGMLLWRRRTR